MIYVDNAATTKVCRAAIDEMLPFFDEKFGNPSSPNLLGSCAAAELRKARRRMASLLGAEESEIIFTSGGTESNNLAITIGANRAKSIGRRRIIISEIEHDSVYITAKNLIKQGFEVITVHPHSDGIIYPQDIVDNINEKTALVSVMAANNEIGTIQPYEEIAKLCRAHGVYFHTDGVQAVGHINIDLSKSEIGMMSISAHKFGGPKGIGALYIRNNITSSPLILGGNQEKGLRAGTEPLPLIAAMARALEDSLENLPQKQKKTAELRDILEERLALLPDVKINGGTNRLAGHLNISFKGRNSDALLMALEENGICASKGSACHSGDEKPSRVLTALGLTEDYALGTLRFSLNHENTKEEIEFIADTVIDISKRGCKKSPDRKKEENFPKNI